MGLFHDDESGDAEHPEPATIDLGLQKAFEVQMVVTELQNEGLTLYLLDKSDLGDSAQLYPAQCQVLVRKEDEARAREVFTEAGFL